MNTMNRITPDGTRDLLYGEAERYDRLTQLFSDVYAQNGFRKVKTPVIENYHLITEVNQSIQQENLYKLTDNTGHLFVIRPDNTTPMARVAATKLRSAPLPQKLYYNQNIYRINSDYSGKRNEILQSGVELIGATGLKADLLCIMTALESLNRIKSEWPELTVKLEIGHVGYFNALIDELDLSDDDLSEVRDNVEAKNFVSLSMNNVLSRSEKIRQLPMLFGGDEVLPQARVIAADNTAAIEALDYVEKLYYMLKRAGYGDYILIDMGMVHKFDYYTGVIFRGYIENAGEPMLKGGRYDKLLAHFDYDVPATGFAINVCALDDAVQKMEKSAAKEAIKTILHYDDSTYEKAVNLKNSYHAKGLECELSVFDDAEETRRYAEKLAIDRVIDLTLKQGVAQ